MIDPSWVLALMLRAEHAPERSPYRPTYEETAAAIAKAASALPLFSGPKGAEKTAAFLVSVAWHESNFRQDAEGDHEKLPDGKKGRPRSFCAMQIHESNFAAFGVTREAITLGSSEQSAISRCIEVGLRLLHVSFAVCREKPIEGRLDHYATGGSGCRKPLKDEGAHRVRKALRLFKEVPPPSAP